MDEQQEQAPSNPQEIQSWLNGHMHMFTKMADLLQEHGMGEDVHPPLLGFVGNLISAFISNAFATGHGAVPRRLKAALEEACAAVPDLPLYTLRKTEHAKLEALHPVEVIEEDEIHIAILIHSIVDGPGDGSQQLHSGPPGRILRLPLDVTHEEAVREIIGYLHYTRKWLDTADRPGRERQRVLLPDVIRQQTFIEARQAGQALAEGPTFRHWQESESETALYHIVEGVPIQIRLVPSASLEWFDQPRPATAEGLRAEISQAGIPAMLTLYTTLALVIEQDRVSLTLDDIIRLIGWVPRKRKEREEMRRKVWRWMLMLSGGLHVVGAREGRWKDPDTGRVLDLTSRDPLIVITGTDVPKQPALDNSEPPIAVHLTAGAWVERFRGNRKVLSDFGDVRRIAAIPAGQPSGAWAQAIGLALNQRWRECGSRAEVNRRTGEDNHLTVRNPRPFTRRGIFSLFPPDPPVEEILESRNPRRAQEYWCEAIGLLKQHKILGHTAELAPLPGKRQGWKEPWLDQPLDLRPCQDGMKAQAQLATRAKRARRRKA